MTKTYIKKLLAAAAFDPKTKGPLSTILEMSDSVYLLQRTLELIREAQMANGPGERAKPLLMATQLLTMVRGLDMPEPKKGKNEPAA